MQPSPIDETTGPRPPNFRTLMARRLHYNSRQNGAMTRVIAQIVLATAIAGAQEHSYTPADIDNGARLYQSSCAGCHGPNGEMVPGIELFRGQYRRATSDVDLIRIVQSGIAGTTMPPSSFTDNQAG